MKAAVDYWLGNDWEYEGKHRHRRHKDTRFNLPRMSEWPSILEEQSSKNISAIAVVFVDKLTQDEKHHLSTLLARGSREGVWFVTSRRVASIEPKHGSTVDTVRSKKVASTSRVPSFWQRGSDDFCPFFREESHAFYERLHPIHRHRNVFYSKEDQWLDFISSREPSLFDDVAESMYSAATNKIKQLGRYSEGWDGFNAKAPTMKAVEDAEAFIQKLRNRRLELPYISLATDGEINFLWSQHSIHLDLGFYGDGKYSYYGRTATGKEYLEDDVPVNSPLPRTILMLLSHA